MTQETEKPTREPRERRAIITDPNAAPLSYTDMRRTLGIAGQPIAAKDLVGKTFVIHRAQEFKSAFENTDHVYYCTVKLVDDAELYSVVLGGGALVDVLDAIADAGLAEPMKVTLRYKERGEDNSYYFFE